MRSNHKNILYKHWNAAIHKNILQDFGTILKRNIKKKNWLPCLYGREVQELWHQQHNLHLQACEWKYFLTPIPIHTWLYNSQKKKKKNEITLTSFPTQLCYQPGSDCTERVPKTKMQMHSDSPMRKKSSINWQLRILKLTESILTHGA